MSQMDDLKLGALILIPQKEGKASPLPLQHTAVSGRITGPIASVTVTQRFGNPFDHPIELEYLFPLPDKGAVVDYEITIGERTIKADIKERDSARQVYEQAVSEGKRASLLEQRRPNLFSIEIGNVQPGENIITRLTYEDRLQYRDGLYEFVFPMGITPKYHTAETSEAAANAVDAPVELDNSTISKVEIDLQVDTGVSAGDPTSRTHPLTVKRKNEREFSLTLAGEHIPNKDFVLQYAIAEDDIRAAVWSSHDEDDSDTVLVTLLPPQLDITAEPPPREFIFVIDRSGSMSGGPMEQAKNALRACIRALGENDTFTIEAFDTYREWYMNKPIPVTQAHVDEADSWIEQLNGRGGTEIVSALQEALAVPVDKERQRYVVFLTDGAVSAEEQVLKDIASKRGNARIFSFGIGPSVNRYLLNKMAEIGRGTSDFMGVQDDIEGTMTRFQDRVSYPALLDIQLQWEGAESWDTYPALLPDLYVGQPLEISTRLARQGKVRLNVSGKLRGEVVNLSVDIPKADDTNPTLRRVWARARVESLQDENVRGGDAEKIRQQIISLGLAHRLVTRYTSFVAVDSEVTEHDKDSEKVNVSVPLPEGLDPAGFGLPTTGARLFSLGATNTGVTGIMPPSPSSAPASAPRMYRRATGVSEEVELGKVQSKGIFNRLIGSLKPSGGRSDKKEASEGKAPAEPMDSRLMAFDAPAPEREAPEETAETFTTIDERIKWLARTQQVNGSWDDNAEMTTAALLAFVRAGHTHRTGNYRRQVAKAANWLASWTLQHASNFAGFTPFAVVRALDELNTAAGDYAVPDNVRDALPKPQSASERATLGEGTALDAVATLDDLRVVALLQGAASAPDELTQGAQSPLVQAWLAVGKSAR